MIVFAEQLHGTVTSPPSKSALHRRLILNRIAGTLEAPDALCTDTAATFECLKRLGTNSVLDCRESGSTLRFLLPVSLLFGGARFTGSASLGARPIKPLLDALRLNGAQIDTESFPISLSGRLHNGTYVLDGSVSSQFFSGLLMTLPFLSGDSMLRWTAPLGSSGYVDLTANMLAEHNVEVMHIENGFRVPGGQTPIVRKPVVEGDWSCAAVMLILGAIAGSVTVTGLDQNSLQPDRCILDVLAQCGAHIEKTNSAVTVRRGTLRGFKFNGEAAPDLVPVLAALGCASEGDSVLYRLERLRYKESNRFDALTALLSALGADFETERGNTIVIHGSGSIRGGTADIPADHRMVMAAALMSTCAASPVSIPHSECVEKSYPSFFRDFVSLGGHTDAI